MEVRPEGHREPCNKVGSLSQAEHLVGIRIGKFSILIVTLNPLGHSLLLWHAGLLHKFRSYGISGQVFDLVSSFFSNRRLRVVLDRKSSQLMLELLKVPFLILQFSLRTFLMMLFVTFLSMLMIQL